MIIGRRLRAANEHQVVYEDERKHRVLDVEFQRRHTLYLVTAVMGAALVFFIPALYFIYSNYVLLSVLVDKTEPLLYDQLHRETIWLVGFCLASLATLSGVCVYFGLRLTHQLLGPVHAIESEMLKVAAGDGSKARTRFRMKDDFRSYTTSYVRLVQSLREQSMSDLRDLQKIHVDPEDRISQEAWQRMMGQKSKFLGIDAAVISSDPDAKIAEWSAKRRVS